MLFHTVLAHKHGVTAFARALHRHMLDPWDRPLPQEGPVLQPAVGGAQLLVANSVWVREGIKAE